MVKNIFKQSSWLILAQMISRGIGFLYTIYLAKNLGVEDFGKFSVAMAYFSLISSFADFGFNRYLIREVVADKLRASRLLFNIGLFRATLTSVLFAVFSIVLSLTDPDKSRVAITLLAVLAVVPMGVSQTIDAIFVAIQKLQLSSISTVMVGIVTASLGVFLISNYYGLTGAILALFLGQLIYLFIQVLLLKTIKIPIGTRVEKETLIQVFVSSLPYGLLGVLGFLYFRIDTLMLTYLRGNYDVGIYTAAYKFLDAIIFIPSGLAVAVFPVMVRLHHENLKQLRELYFNSIKTMVMISLLVVVSYLVVLPAIIERFLPNYLPSINVIKILSLAIPFMFIHAPGVQVLLSTDKYLKQVIGWSFVTLGFNFTANLVVIPRYGYLGAAWVTVASEILSFIIFFLFINRKIFKKSYE